MFASRNASVSLSGRHAISFSRTISAIVIPVASPVASSSAPEENGRGNEMFALTGPDPASTIAPPPIEK
jgi:hypothetical protein